MIGTTSDRSTYFISHLLPWGIGIILFIVAIIFLYHYRANSNNTLNRSTNTNKSRLTSLCDIIDTNNLSTDKPHVLLENTFIHYI